MPKLIAGRLLQMAATLLVVSAHLDTVFPEGTPIKVRRDGDKLHAPGVGDDSAVVLYNKGFPMWATRVWWMLRSIGFDNVAVLNGGYEKWVKENVQ